MGRENLEKFFKFLAENPNHQDKVKSFGGDVNALVALAKELGYEIDAGELRDYREKSLQLLKGRMEKKLAQPGDSQGPGVQAFFALMNLAETDEEVAAKLAELGAGEPEELIAYGKEKGFVFDRQDMLDIGKDILEPTDELSEEELELVAGGTTLVLLGFLAVGLVAAGGLAAGAVVGGGAAAMVVAFTSAMK